MRTTTANYTTYNANLYKKPVYIVEFTGITAKIVSGTWNNIGSYTTNKWLRTVRASMGRIDIHEPDIAASTFTMEVIDKSAGFTSYMNTNSLWGRAVTIKIGFQELDYADFVTLTPQNTFVTDIRLNSDLITWTVEARDNLFNLIGAKFNDGFLGRNSLRSILTSGETSSIDLNGNSVFWDIDDIGNNFADERVFPVVKIDSEIIRYDDVVTGLLFELQVLIRGMGNTTAAEHAAGAKVFPGLGFNCDPLRIMLHLLTTSFPGTNGNYDLDLDAAKYNFRGIQKNRISSPVTYTDINIDNIERLGWRMFHEVEYLTYGYFYYFIDDVDDVLDIIQERLLKPHGLYLMINGGKLDVGHNDYVYFFENFSASDTLTDSNVKRINGLEHSGYDQVYNEFSFLYEYNQLDGETSSSSSQTHNSTAETYYSDNSLSITHHGMDPATDTDIILWLVRHRFLNFADINTIIKADCFHSKILLEPGDTPSITTSYLANIDTNSRSWSAVKARLIGQELVAGVDESFIENELRVFTVPGYVDNALSGYYSINKVAEGSINDKALTVSTDLTATIEAVDAYYDNLGSAYQADRIIFFIRITPPNFGGGSDFETIDLQISWLDATPTIQNSDRRRYIAFNPQSSTAFTIALDLYGKNATADTPRYTKVDWNATTAAGGEVPTVEFVGVWFVKLNLAS